MNDKNYSSSNITSPPIYSQFTTTTNYLLPKTLSTYFDLTPHKQKSFNNLKKENNQNLNLLPFYLLNNSIFSSINPNWSYQTTKPKATTFSINYCRRESMQRLEFDDKISSIEDSNLKQATKNVNIQIPNNSKITTNNCFKNGKENLLNNSTLLLPNCLENSNVVKEKPTLKTRIFVCLISSFVICFCLIKLFYWK
uniref:Uncharacterized protein n=1 Tax=Meloidogyne enterolobii TaxID=390850 RepID=A0A6V7V8C7_MELEN|nr:unnamed protein product [Meloidogyne enterolobii]